MDWPHEVRQELEIEVFHQVATLLDLEVDLLFFDTTSTYFELEEPDEPIDRDTAGRPLADGDGDGNSIGFRTYGKSKDSRDDLPQIVIGMAVTRTGIPVRVWCWPGNTADSTLIRQVKDDMRDWTLARIVWVADRGFSSAENRRYLRSGDHQYIIGEKLRSDSPEIKAALSRQGRYTEISQNMRAKEVKVSDTERFVICHNPEQARRDGHIRTQLVAQLTELIEGTDTLTATKRAELRGKISTKPGLNRYLRVTPGGLLRIDATKVKTESNLDGKYLLRCSDPHLSAEDIALGYK
jgi:Transposase DDE domain